MNRQLGLIAALRSCGDFSTLLALGALFQFLACEISFLRRQGWREPVGPAVIKLYVIALSWLLVAAGGDRQDLHRVIRDHSQAVTVQLKAGAVRNDLIDRLRAEPLLAKVDFDAVLAEGHFVGRAPEQVDEFIAEQVQPMRERYRPALGQAAEVNV